MLAGRQNKWDLDFGKVLYYMQFLMISSINLKLTPKANPAECFMINKWYSILNVWELALLPGRWLEELAKPVLLYFNIFLSNFLSLHSLKKKKGGGTYL
jgi:hypothetical protein